MSGRDEDEVGGLAAGLEAETRSGQLNEGGRAPTMAGATGHDALTILSADNEGSFFEARYDGNACRLGGDALRDSFVGGTHEFVKDLMGGLDALVEFRDVGGQCWYGDGGSETKHLDDFHIKLPFRREELLSFVSPI